jgi:hypothetical protein
MGEFLITMPTEPASAVRESDFFDRAAHPDRTGGSCSVRVLTRQANHVEFRQFMRAPDCEDRSSSTITLGNTMEGGATAGDDCVYSSTGRHASPELLHHFRNDAHQSRLEISTPALLTSWTLNASPNDEAQCLVERFAQGMSSSIAVDIASLEVVP